jgi:O-antigen ligase
MRPSHHSRLATLRLLLLFLALCLSLAHLEVAQRQLQNQITGLPAPFLPDEPLPPASRLPFLGVSVDPNRIASQERDTFYQEIAAAGFGWVRVRVAWDHIETAPRNFSWQTLDRTLDALETNRLVPVLLLDGSPAWARAPSDRHTVNGHLAPPANPAAFARFARAVAERYGERVRYYQIWDEPNIAPHWGARHVEATNYARLLKASATMLRDHDPDAYIILAALAPTVDRGHLAQDEQYFLQRLYAAGAAPYFDAAATQPFGFGSAPNDPTIRLDALNFRRTLLIRQTMLDAGDGETPLWLMRFGWNRTPMSPWRAVSAENQIAFTRDALTMAYEQWPWVVGMGWPTATAWENDSDAGFALTPELEEMLRIFAATHGAQRRPLQSVMPPLSLWMPVTLWWGVVIALLWRAAIVARQVPWEKLYAFWRVRPSWQQGMAWALLILLYYWAVWPPLILLYLIIAALGFLAQPRVGLVLALVLLPFYAYHKEFNWLGVHWQIPPTQMLLLCLLPAAWRYWPHPLARDRWLVLALAWFAVMLLSASGVWFWPAFAVGMVNLVLTPLLLFLLIRAWATTPSNSMTFVAALAAGGVLIALIGLADWLQGGGAVVDGMRRLEGLGFSSNHTALYLIRTLAIAIGLALAGGTTRWLWVLWAALTGAALLLTGSRGAIMLGIPAGALFVFNRQNLPLPSRRRLLGLAMVIGLSLIAIGWMWRERLANVGTMFARMDGWLVALTLWLDHFLFGVGPGGFWWTFPAQMGITSDADPNLRHPHNAWLEFATGGGLLALVWLGAAIYLLVRWVKAKQGALSWLQTGLLAGLIAAFAHAQVDAFQALPELAGWNWAALALLLALDKNEA